MKFYSHEDFMKLPEGTFFHKGKKYSSGKEGEKIPYSFYEEKNGICIKGQTIDKNKYLYNDLFAEMRIPGAELEEMFIKNINKPLQECWTTDIAFDDDIFFVYKAADLITIKEKIDEFLEVAIKQGRQYVREKTWGKNL
jgi:hypothetical protein